MTSSKLFAPRLTRLFLLQHATIVRRKKSSFVLLISRYRFFHLILLHVRARNLRAYRAHSIAPIFHNKQTLPNGHVFYCKFFYRNCNGAYRDAVQSSCSC